MAFKNGSAASPHATHNAKPPEEAVTAAQLGQTLVAYEPAGDDEQWDTIEAYDSQGNLFRLDARRGPSYR